MARLFEILGEQPWTLCRFLRTQHAGKTTLGRQAEFNDLRKEIHNGEVHLAPRRIATFEQLSTRA